MRWDDYTSGLSSDDAALMDAFRGLTNGLTESTEHVNKSEVRFKRHRTYANRTVGPRTASLGLSAQQPPGRTTRRLCHELKIRRQRISTRTQNRADRSPWSSVRALQLGIGRGHGFCCLAACCTLNAPDAELVAFNLVVQVTRWCVPCETDLMTGTDHHATDSCYRNRVDALEAVWCRWSEIGAGLSEPQWSSATRCTGWDVAALYAHVGMFPSVLADPPRAEVDASATVVTAVDILRGFNAPGGVAITMAEQVATAAVSSADRCERSALVAIFAEDGPRAIAALRNRGPRSLVPWPGADALTTWAEALRIVLMESVVHVLDVFDGLGLEPNVPEAALRETTHLLAEVAEPVRLIEAATGRSSDAPLPVLR